MRRPRNSSCNPQRNALSPRRSSALPARTGMCFFPRTSSHGKGSELPETIPILVRSRIDVSPYRPESTTYAGLNSHGYMPPVTRWSHSMGRHPGTWSGDAKRRGLPPEPFYSRIDWPKSPHPHRPATRPLLPELPWQYREFRSADAFSLPLVAKKKTQLVSWRGSRDLCWRGDTGSSVPGEARAS